MDVGSGYAKLSFPRSGLSRLLLCCLFFGESWAQDAIRTITSLDPDQVPAGKISRYWVHVMNDGMSRPIQVPLLVARGESDGPVLGLTAAIHGNELNGIAVIQRVFMALDPSRMKGMLVGVPGLNPVAITLEQRRFIDGEDLNRNFPGKASGNRSQQFNQRVFDKIVRRFQYHLDLHSASFGRVNSYYVRADLEKETFLRLASLQNADIILHSQGKPSFGSASAGARTLRAEAALHGIASITVEYGDPQVFQADMIERGKAGILNTMRWLKMIEGPLAEAGNKPVICKKSYWVYTDEGGLLEVPVLLRQQLKKGERIGILRNPFGEVLREYFCPQDGIVIGKSTNPVSMTGGRIIHLGILQ